MGSLSPNLRSFGYVTTILRTWDISFWSAYNVIFIYIGYFEMTPSVCEFHITSHLTSSFGRKNQTAFPTSSTWASHIAAIKKYLYWAPGYHDAPILCPPHMHFLHEIVSFTWASHISHMIQIYGYLYIFSILKQILSNPSCITGI